MYNIKIISLLACFIIGTLTARAQEIGGILDIFMHEGLTTIKNSDFEYQGLTTPLSMMKINEGRYTPLDIQSNYENKVYLVETPKSLGNSDTRAIDSTIQILRNGRISELHNYTDPMYLDTGGTSLETFAEMLKKANGNLDTLIKTNKQTIFIWCKKRTYAVISGTAIFSKAAGAIKIYFRLGDDNKYRLAKIFFLPNNGQRNLLIKSISLNDVSLLVKKDVLGFEQHFTKDFAKQMSRHKSKFEKELAQYSINDSLFTYNIFNRDAQLFLTCVFYTTQPGKYLYIRYTPVDKKFMIDNVSIVKPWE